VKQAQTALKQKGLYNGPVDGQVGPATRNAIMQFQQQNGLKQSAQLDSSTMSTLQSNSNTSSGGARSYSQPPAGAGGANMSSPPPSSPDRM
jgi:peptidoglycan hydrolase-like protein with peptidoglycan-binding domain